MKKSITDTHQVNIDKIMKIEELKEEYKKIVEKYDGVKSIVFSKNLCKSNDIDVLDFHYRILKNQENELFFYRIRGCFDKHGEAGEKFLLDKIDTEQDPDLRAEALFLLGTMKCEKTKPVALSFLKHKNRRDRYYGIIVIGWIGNKDDLAILDERLQNEPDDELRGYAATAMRQIWYSKKATDKDILPYLYQALKTEISELTLSMIIVVIQDLLQRKFGLQEIMEEDTIRGDVQKAKEKIIKSLNL